MGSENKINGTYLITSMSKSNKKINTLGIPPKVYRIVEDYNDIKKALCQNNLEKKVVTRFDKIKFKEYSDPAEKHEVAIVEFVDSVLLPDRDEIKDSPDNEEKFTVFLLSDTNFIEIRKTQKFYKETLEVTKQVQVILGLDY